MLYDIVKEVNTRVFFIEDESELRHEWFKDAETVGITGATSTPQWLMDRVKDEIERKYSNVSKYFSQPSIVHEIIKS